MKTTCRKKYRIKSKFRFITSVVIMAGLMIGIIGAVSGLNVSRALTETKYKEVQICYGDVVAGRLVSGTISKHQIWNPG